MRIYVKNANFYSEKEERPNNFFIPGSVLTIKGNDIFCAGSAGYKGEPFNYALSGYFSGRGFFIDKLEIGKDDFYTHLGGNIKGKTLKLKGLALINTSLKEGVSEPSLIFTGNIARFKMPKADLSVFDIDSEIEFNMPDITLKKLTFLMNKNYFSFKGRLSLSEDPSLELQAIYIPVERGEFENLKKLFLYAKGAIGKSGFKGDAKLNLEIENKQATYPLLDRIEVDCDGLSLKFNDNRTYFSASSVSGRRKTKDNTQSAILEDFKGVLRRRNKNLCLLSFYSKFYDGSLRGAGVVELSAKPTKVSLWMRVKDADANKLNGLLVHFSKVTGNF
jgi:hypothetical protein